MSKKTNKPESKNTQDSQGGTFELSSSAMGEAQSTYIDNEGILKRLDPSLWLPATVGSFIRFFVVIAVLVLGSTVNIYISAQISEAKIEQRALAAEYLAIQQQNAQIAWEISEYTSLDQIRQRAVNIGYIGAPSRSYAISPISDDTLAVLGATILADENAAMRRDGSTAQNPIDDQFAPNSDLEATQPDASQQGQDIVLAANISANRLVETGLLKAIKEIDGR